MAQRLTGKVKHAAMVMYAHTGNAKKVAAEFDVSSASIYSAWHMMPEAKKKELRATRDEVLESITEQIETEYIDKNKDKMLVLYDKITDARIEMVSKIVAMVKSVDTTYFDPEALSAVTNALQSLSTIAQQGASTSEDDSAEDFLSQITSNSVINIQNNYGKDQSNDPDIGYRSGE